MYISVSSVRCRGSFFLQAEDGIGDLVRSRGLGDVYKRRILEGAVFDHPPPMVDGRRIKLRYAHAGGQNPPLILSLIHI